MRFSTCKVRPKWRGIKPLYKVLANFAISKNNNHSKNTEKFQKTKRAKSEKKHTPKNTSKQTPIRATQKCKE
ncbi:hypothetical protein COV18_00550 [Candidatus Woesearchaeota archaeon CG10_big_fil_rev_8_21_14_0_10_37_12]|nr:MAG: hypothetical protein COV18_00550 [Candidatus Woesearchaeota archaeon CG10_big_fil_rev_8_21_14_0_10_37_12]